MKLQFIITLTAILGASLSLAAPTPDAAALEAKCYGIGCKRAAED
jgi:hypothetical protein